MTSGKKIKHRLSDNLARALNREPEEVIAARVPRSLKRRLMERLKLNGHTVVQFITACAQAYLQEDDHEDPRH